MNQTIPSFKVAPIPLEGKFVCLEPLQMEHASQLWDVMKNDAEDIFRWIPYLMRTAEDARHFVKSVLGEQQRGVSMPFATGTQLQKNCWQYAVHEH